MSFFLISFFTIPLEIKNARLNLALKIPKCAPVTVANDAAELLPVVTDKKLMTCQNRQKKQYTY